MSVAPAADCLLSEYITYSSIDFIALSFTVVELVPATVPVKFAVTFPLPSIAASPFAAPDNTVAFAVPPIVPVKLPDTAAVTIPVAPIAADADAAPALRVALATPPIVPVRFPPKIVPVES